MKFYVIKSVTFKARVSCLILVCLSYTPSIAQICSHFICSYLYHISISLSLLPCRPPSIIFSFYFSFSLSFLSLFFNSWAIWDNFQTSRYLATKFNIQDLLERRTFSYVTTITLSHLKNWTLIHIYSIYNQKFPQW